MTAPLKPCPFCGSRNVGRWSPNSFVVCHDCVAEGPGGQTDDAAAWNTRADAPELLALVDAVKEIVSDAWGYGHLFDTPFHARVHDVLHEKLLAYEALQ